MPQEKHLGPLVGYTCPKCGFEMDERATNFCGRCGCKLPSEIRLQATGYARYLYEYFAPLKTTTEINDFLALVGKTKHYLANYFAFMRTLQIAIPENDSLATNLMLTCSDTHRISTRVGDGWYGLLQVREIDSGIFSLYDEENMIDVVAGSIHLREDVGR